jgi:hypothetical protein
MIDPMTPVLAGLTGAQLAAVLLRRWLTLRARAELTRAAADLPAGVRVHGRDTAGTWTAHRTQRGDR